MRIAFFHGILGEADRLVALRRFAGSCERWICLGDLYSAERGVDLELGSLLGEDASLTCLAGEQERRLQGRSDLPAASRDAVGALPQVGVEGGVALIGSGVRSRRARGSEPKLVAALTIAASRGRSRLWRQVGALSRVEEARRGVWWLDGEAKIRLDLAAGTSLAILDTESGRLELHCLDLQAVLGREADHRPHKLQQGVRQHRLARRVAPGQIALAI